MNSNTIIKVLLIPVIIQAALMVGITFYGFGYALVKLTGLL